MAEGRDTTANSESRVYLHFRLDVRKRCRPLSQRSAAAIRSEVGNDETWPHLTIERRHGPSNNSNKRSPSSGEARQFTKNMQRKLLRRTSKHGINQPSLRDVEGQLVGAST